MYPVAILAGGLGTRMAQRTSPALPKAMLPLAGRPFIDLKLEQLAAAGAARIVLLVGHGREAIADHVGDGAAFGLSVTSVPDGDVLLGTGGAVRRVLPALGPVFWVTFGDNLLSVPMDTVEGALMPGDGGIMTVLRNRDAWDLSNVTVDGDRVVEYRKGAPPGTYDYIDYGMSLLRADAFGSFPAGEALDLTAVLQSLIAESRLGAFEVTERFYEIGSEAGYAETEAYARSWLRRVASAEAPRHGTPG
jgi:MurNAc alpha-1-phosphate uridylyltransferase